MSTVMLSSSNASVYYIGTRPRGRTYLWSNVDTHLGTPYVQ